MKKLKHQIINLVGSFVAWLTIQIIGHTTRFILSGSDYPESLSSKGKGFILALWHGRTLLPVYYYRHRKIWAITSLSRDGELQTKIIQRLGFQTIRGSSGKDGMRAALTACKKLSAGGILAITPDGPRGPIYEIQEGIIFMSYHSGVPIIPVGVGLSSRKIINAWDKYAFPYPFGKCSIVFGKPLDSPADKSEEEFARMAELLKFSINEVQKQAEQNVGEGDY